MNARRRDSATRPHRQLGLYRKGTPNPVLIERFADPQLPPLETAALFAGIAGIELGLERAGHRTRLFCEADPGAIAVLEKQFPGITVHRDVRDLTPNDVPEEVRLLTAGFPCQDLSQAGTTRGIAGDRSGLVGQVFRILEDRRIDTVLIENVSNMLHLKGGSALDLIVTEFERLGYRWAYRVVDTMAFGIPQRRKRVFFLASRTLDPRRVLFADSADPVDTDPRETNRDQSFGFYWTEGSRGVGATVDGVPTLKGGSSVGVVSPPAIVLPGGRVVRPHICDAERLQGFEPDWTLPAEESPKGPRSRWMLIGNAVTVDVAQWIGHRLRSPGDIIPLEPRNLPRGSKWPSAAWNVGDGRYSAPISDWPYTDPLRPIHDFLEFDPEDLSERATRGFYTRLQASSLRCYPDWFKPVLEAHLEQFD